MAKARTRPSFAPRPAPAPASARILARALDHHRAGRLPEAEAGYRQVLGMRPDDPDALHLLGVLAHQVGAHEAAVALITRAIAMRSSVADFHSNLAAALGAQGRAEEAEAESRRALALRPAYPEALSNLGNALARQGRLDEAEASLRRALALAPRSADVLNDLGNVLRARGRLAEAEASYRRALAQAPDVADFHSNLGTVLRAQDRVPDAIASYERALALRPGHAEAHANLATAYVARGHALHREQQWTEATASYEHALALDPRHVGALVNLGAALTDQGKGADAIPVLERALAIAPDDADALTNLGNALAGERRLQEAVASYERAIARRPDYAQALSNLGNALTRLGRFGEAEAAYRRALALDPDFAEALSNLSNALWMQGKLEEAVASAERALALRPDFAETSINLSNALLSLQRNDEAAAVCRRAVAARPDDAKAWGNLGNAHTAQGDLGAAIAAYRRAIELRPDYVEGHSNLVFVLDFDPRTTSAQAFEERRRFDAMHARPLASRIRPHGNDRDPERRLRVGYVSADFRRHSAAAVFGPVVLGHDRDVFDVICYSAVRRPDEQTTRFQAAATAWRDTLALSDGELAQLVRDDRVDILVDLSGYSSGHRLLAFAEKPAPVQVTAWGHALGTGLGAMDYFFADPVTVPPAARCHFAEEVIDLPALAPYDPLTPSPAVAPLPALEAPAVTFGSFNRLSKLTTETLALWARILGAVPGARLLFKFSGLERPANQARLRATLAAGGVGADRVFFLGGTTPFDHLATYAAIDLALDPFPHGGGVTALDGLWMGVPMVTLLGERIPARFGASVLTALGLEEFVARTPEEYVALAVRHVADIGRLATLRRELRGRLAASPICDHPAYVAAVERAYRAMWRRWCATAT